MSVSRNAKTGKFDVQAWYRDQDGQRRHKTRRGFATKAAACAWERDFVARMAGSMTMKLTDFVGVYEEDVRPKLKDSTWVVKEHIIAKWIVPYLGDKPMDQIAAIDISRWQNILLQATGSRGKPLSDAYIRNLEAQLSAIFNHACRLYGLADNPMAMIPHVGDRPAPSMSIWTTDQFKAFARCVMDKPLVYLAFNLLYWTGLREGELLALLPEDFDLAKGTVSVTKTYYRKGAEDVVTSPKTRKSVRVVKMPDELTAMVADHLRLYPGASDERVFAALSKSRLHAEMTRGARDAGVPRIRIHDLRHSHVSMLIDLGFSVVAIADRLGHESTGITYMYAHLLPQDRDRIARGLDAVMKE